MLRRTLDLVPRGNVLIASLDQLQRPLEHQRPRLGASLDLVKRPLEPPPFIEVCALGQRHSRLAESVAPTATSLVESTLSVSGLHNNYNCFNEPFAVSP